MNAVVGPLQRLEILQPYVNSEAVDLLRESSNQLERIRTALANSASPQN